MEESLLNRIYTYLHNIPPYLHPRVTEQHLVSEDVLRHPDAPVRVEDGVRRPGGQHQRVPWPL